MCWRSLSIVRATNVASAPSARARAPGATSMGTENRPERPAATGPKVRPPTATVVRVPGSASPGRSMAAESGTMAYPTARGVAHVGHRGASASRTPISG